MNLQILEKDGGSRPWTAAKKSDKFKIDRMPKRDS